VLTNLLLPAVPGVELREVFSGAESITLVMQMTRPTAPCPLCQRDSGHVHSHYQRHLADLPWAETPVQIQLRVRRFFCDNPACSRRIFVERLSPAIAPYARRTRRLAARLEMFGLTAGGEAGAFLARRSGMPASANTLLRLIRRRPADRAPTPRVVGVDDWAQRKRMRYGTILVDLEAHRPIELLPDREPASVAAWLCEHPGVEIVARDRSTEYARGIAAGAPQARQVADRWHVLSNVRETVHRMLQRHPADLRAAVRRVTATAGADSGTPGGPPGPSSTSPAASERERLYHAIRQLTGEGQSQRAIAQQLHVNRATIKKYLRAPEVPGDRRGPTSRLATGPYGDHLRRRWTAGVHNIRQLWRELQGLGYRGSYSSVWDVLRHFPRSVPSPAGSLPVETGAPLSARQASWLLVQPPEALTPTEEVQRAALLESCADAATAYPLVQAFGQMVRQKQADHLDTWLAQAESSRLPDLLHFAQGVRRDYAAVQAALSLPWSNGQTEGQVNRLKTIRRQMYGRGNFDLVRRRVLYQRE
jgi:transposase